MCGRYSLFIPLQEVADKLGVGVVPNPDWQPLYNVAPSLHMPVITNEFPDVVQFFKWGLVPQWAKDPSVGMKMVNTRMESILEKPSFRNIFRYKRCVILCSGYYEWQTLPGEVSAKGKKGKPLKQPWRFYNPSDDLILLAGLWDHWGREGLKTFSIITCEANNDTRDIHNRMPVILSYKEAKQWLRKGTDIELLTNLLKQAPEGLLKSYKVSTYINRAGNEGPEVIEPIAEVI